MLGEIQDVDLIAAEFKKTWKVLQGIYQDFI